MIDFNSIRFPVEGTVNRIVHFSDTFHQYGFSFVSPYVYDQPAQYKARGAFLIAKYNPFNPDINHPEEIYGHFIAEDDAKKTVVNAKRNLNAKRVRLFDGDDRELGSLEVLTPKNRLFGFKTNYPNRIFDAGGTVVGFAHYQPQRQRKAVYSVAPGFDFDRPLTLDDIRSFETEKKISQRFTYGLQQKELDFKGRLEAMFSPNKKSESILNQVNMPFVAEDYAENLRYLLSVIAFFWTTIIDLPVMES